EVGGVDGCVCGGFFFQGEGGIRDWSVTGVQTCALPIYSASVSHTPRGVRPRTIAKRYPGAAQRNGAQPARLGMTAGRSAGSGYRSEERRVGKEGRERGSRGRERKKEGRGGERSGREEST